MLIVSVVVSVVFCVVSLVMSLGLILSFKNLHSREKATPFECGFDNNASNRLPFSLRFFLITIVFLIFDVEIVLLLPSVSSVWKTTVLMWWVVIVIFLVVLIGGLFHEWRLGALKWSL